MKQTKMSLLVAQRLRSEKITYKKPNRIIAFSTLQVLSINTLKKIKIYREQHLTFSIGVHTKQGSTCEKPASKKHNRGIEDNFFSTPFLDKNMLSRLSHRIIESDPPVCLDTYEKKPFQVMAFHSVLHSIVTLLLTKINPSNKRNGARYGLVVFQIR
ncbi:hypothetical protein KDW99_16265 [Marinomonas rhizomae]|uniref:hypothetical protein n=1 Tax=Marinomonas rhizomae TaxID=491948 RepID=UPI0021030DFA|nr:hypothetical protein [Marinomonas rhizomae]UTV98792.1 hypothetical protein KDW99_16265 [Marinomonas rhizomae]